MFLKETVHTSLPCFPWDSLEVVKNATKWFEFGEAFVIQSSVEVTGERINHPKSYPGVIIVLSSYRNNFTRADSHIMLLLLIYRPNSLKLSFSKNATKVVESLYHND